MLSYLFGKGSESDYTRLSTNEDGQQECEGCRGIKILLRRKRNLEDSDPNFRAALHCRVHWNWHELVECAKSCIGCRYIRRAFLLKEVTIQTVAVLQDPRNTGEIWVKLPGRKAPGLSGFQNAVKLELSIRSPHGALLRTADLSCTYAFSQTSTTIPRNPLHPLVVNRIRGWLNECHGDHDKCAKLGFSNENPTNLIKILPNTDQIQLVSGGSMSLSKYVALSYTWGKEKARSEEEVDTIEGNQTTIENKQRRRNGFPRTDLSKTLQDVIHLCECVHLYYLWVDAVCIPEDADWNDEGNKMHEVYGNAHLTVSVCSTERATDPLFKPREAWNYALVPCKYNDMYLINHALSIEYLRQHAPVFARAWTLQEEHLSPRMLYWTPHLAYWSCLTAQYHELELPSAQLDRGLPLQLPVQIGSSSVWSTYTTRPRTPNAPQGFLSKCRSSSSQELHAEWSLLVEDYAHRSMFRASDRFPALSGLAVQYLTANRFYTRSDSITPLKEEYLAGLWRGTFAADLTWVVVPSPEACEVDSNLRIEAPSWSWASVPLRTHTKKDCVGFEEARAFELLDVRFKAGHEPKQTEEEKEDVLEHVKRGAFVQAVKVKGRLRRLVSQTSSKVPWESVQWVANRGAVSGAGADQKSGHATKATSRSPLRTDKGSVTSVERADKEAQEDKFDFRPFINLDIHARDAATGRILSYEAHKQEIVGQLDYAAGLPATPSPTTAEDDDERTLAEGREMFASRDKRHERVAVQEGEEAALWCLEVGTGAMLLLQRATEEEQVRFDGEEKVFLRAGMCKDFRSNFFAEASVENVWLV